MAAVTRLREDQNALLYWFRCGSQIVQSELGALRCREGRLEKWDARNTNASRVKVVTDALGHFGIGVLSPVSGALRTSYNMTDLSQEPSTQSTRQHADVAPMLKLGAFYGLYITLPALMTLNTILRMKMKKWKTVSFQAVDETPCCSTLCMIPSY